MLARIKHARPLPPDPPDDFGASIKVRDELNLSHEGGWWDVTVIKPAKKAAPPKGMVRQLANLANLAALSDAARTRDTTCHH